MKNIIVALKDVSNTGKSSVLRELARHLLTLENTNVIHQSWSGEIPNNADIRLIIEINGRTVAIESCGDPCCDLWKRLQELKEKNCTFIFCTCRTSGETVNNIVDFCKDNNFEFIWTTTYKTSNNEMRTALNKQKAKHLWELRQSI